MKRFLHSDGFRFTAMIAIVLLLGVILAGFSHNGSAPVTTVLGALFSPLQKISSAITGNLENVNSAFASSSSYIEENKALKEEVAAYREQLADYEELKHRVDAYEEFYDVKKENPDYQFSYGSVISRDAGDPYNSFVLNTGSKDGVSVNDPVIYGNYVVGIVKKVNAFSCVVCTVLDPDVNIGAYESGTREYCYVCGDDSLYSQGLCKLTGLDNSTSIVSGGIVCTSGSGGVFPTGLIIGSVVAVKNDSITASYYAEIKPFFEANEISDVFVITNFDGKGEGSVIE